MMSYFMNYRIIVDRDATPFLKFGPNVIVLTPKEMFEAATDKAAELALARGIEEYERDRRRQFEGAVQ